MLRDAINRMHFYFRQSFDKITALFGENFRDVSQTIVALNGTQMLNNRSVPGKKGNLRNAMVLYFKCILFHHTHNILMIKSRFFMLMKFLKSGKIVTFIRKQFMNNIY